MDHFLVVGVISILLMKPSMKTLPKMSMKRIHTSGQPYPTDQIILLVRVGGSLKVWLHSVRMLGLAPAGSHPLVSLRVRLRSG